MQTIRASNVAPAKQAQQARPRAVAAAPQRRTLAGVALGVAAALAVQAPAFAADAESVEDKVRQKVCAQNATAQICLKGSYERSAKK